MRFERYEERRGDTGRGDDPKPEEHPAAEASDRRPARPQPHPGLDIPVVTRAAHDLTSVRMMRTICWGPSPRRNSAAANSRSTIMWLLTTR
jgi:hypothetical protein